MMTTLLLQISLATAVVGALLLYVMVIPVRISGEQESYRKGLTDTSQTSGLMPLHQRFLHQQTTAHYRNRALLPLLQFARFALYGGGLIALTSGIALVFSR